MNEDFAVESLAGDIFQLGNTAYRIMRVERGIVRVEDAHGRRRRFRSGLARRRGAATSFRMSVSRLRAEIERAPWRRPAPARPRCAGSTDDLGLDQRGGASRSVEYLACGAQGARRACPRRETLVFERFFDEAGGMQLVIHSPYGSRINRAWGLALRKRFCRKFNFELQAAATEDNIVLSLTTAHSFELADVARYLNSKTVREMLIQALLDAPMFATRWRWVAGVALALPRFRGGKKVPPQIRGWWPRILIGTIFPDQVACAENLVGEREVPDHPLVAQTISDCLNEAMDIDGLERLLAGLESGDNPGRRPRFDRALAAGARGADGSALRLSRRCAARGAPDPGGHEPALARSGVGFRARPARRNGDRPRSRRSMARRRERR